MIYYYQEILNSE